MPVSSAGDYLLKTIPSGTSAKDHFQGYLLNARAAADLVVLAREDARRYVYNAVVCLLGGIGGLHTQQAAWAITQLYYTAFYVGRAALCRAGFIVFHAPKQPAGGHTQYEIRALAGQQARAAAKTPSTHKLVALRFQQIGYPTFMRGLTIDSKDPVLWLMEQREYWQYRSARFPDPDFPDILLQVDSRRLQKLLNEYASDRVGLYLADPAHAVVSVPFRLVQWALSVENLTATGVIDESDVAYLRRRCHSGRQMLTAISKCL